MSSSFSEICPCLLCFTAPWIGETGMASMGENRNADKVLVGKCEGQWPLERQV